MFKRNSSHVVMPTKCPGISSLVTVAIGQWECDDELLTFTVKTVGRRYKNNSFIATVLISSTSVTNTVPFRLFNTARSSST